MATPFRWRAFSNVSNTAIGVCPFADACKALLCSTRVRCGAMVATHVKGYTNKQRSVNLVCLESALGKMRL
jgi:hypothetical protein